MEYFLYVYPIIVNISICKLESENNIAIDYYLVSIRLINLFNLVHVHLIKIGSIKYTKWEVKQQIL